MSSTATVKRNIAQGSKGYTGSRNDAGTLFLHCRGDHHADGHGRGLSSVLPTGRRHGRADNFTAVDDAGVRSRRVDDRLVDALPGPVAPRAHPKTTTSHEAWLGLGSAAAVAAAGSGGFMLAVESVRPVPAIPFWGMAYRQFMFVMLIEVALFTMFVLAGVLFRKRPKIHKAAMLLASLKKTGRRDRPDAGPVFGVWRSGDGRESEPSSSSALCSCWSARSLTEAQTDGLRLVYAVMVAVDVAACRFAVSDAWNVLARAVRKE